MKLSPELLLTMEKNERLYLANTSLSFLIPIGIGFDGEIVRSPVTFSAVNMEVKLLDRTITSSSAHKTQKRFLGVAVTGECDMVLSIVNQLQKASILSKSPLGMLPNTLLKPLLRIGHDCYPLWYTRFSFTRASGARLFLIASLDTKVTCQTTLE